MVFGGYFLFGRGIGGEGGEEGGGKGEGVFNKFNCLFALVLSQLRSCFFVVLEGGGERVGELGFSSLCELFQW